MIQKIVPIARLAKPSIRSSLKNYESKLKVLSGSSMSGGNPPRFYDTEMVIPGGLNFQEKAFYLLKGKLPKTVYERWIPNNGEYVLNQNDQLVTIQRTYEGAIGNIVKSPHGVTGEEIEAMDDSLINDIAGDGSLIDITEGQSDSGESGLFDILKQLSGF